jgi:FMN phosphatase YigB (HAD superfamily)
MNKLGIVIFDIDDTLLKADSKVLSIYKKEPGKAEIKLSTEEYAKDVDAKDPNRKKWFDYRDFNNPQKVYSSIINGTPLIKNLNIMDNYVSRGYDFCFLTARGCEDVVKTALDDFLEFRDMDGTLKKLGNRFKKTLSFAVNDEYKKYCGNSDAEKKANILRDISSIYDNVVFVDDDEKNILEAKKLRIDNLKIIKASNE